MSLPATESTSFGEDSICPDAGIISNLLLQSTQRGSKAGTGFAAPDPSVVAFGSCFRCGERKGNSAQNESVKLYPYNTLDPAETALSALRKEVVDKREPSLSSPFRCRIGDGGYGENDRWAWQVYSGRPSGRPDTVCDPCHKFVGAWAESMFDALTNAEQGLGFEVGSIVLKDLDTGLGVYSRTTAPKWKDLNTGLGIVPRTTVPTRRALELHELGHGGTSCAVPSCSMRALSYAQML